VQLNLLKLIESAKAEGKQVALFFHSKTCGSCAKLDTALTDDANKLPTDLEVLKVDWDSNQDLAKKYNVDKYHTLAFLDGDDSSNVKGLFTVEDIVRSRNLPKTEKVITNYGEYSADAITKAQAEGKDVALFFHSKTCGSCGKLDTALTNGANKLPEDLVVLKTDWDANQAVAKTYKVDKYHTVAFLDGETSQNVKGLFTVEDVESAKAEGKQVALFFHSKTCGSCGKLDASLSADSASLPSDLVVLKTDWTDNQELAKKYNVDKYHTVAFLDGETSKNVKGLFTAGEVAAAK